MKKEKTQKTNNKEVKAKQEDNIHAYHRKRTMETYRKVGAHNLPEHMILELLLFFALPRVDTNIIAHRLIKKFGSLSKVLAAQYEELLTVDGIGDKAATLLHLIGEIMNYCALSETKLKDLKNLDDIAIYLTKYFKNSKYERLVVIPLDCNNIPIKIVDVSEGQLDMVAIPNRKIIDVLNQANTSSFILAHNHPSTISKPSIADISSTIHLCSLFTEFGIKIKEHIVVGKDGYSFTLRDYVYYKGSDDSATPMDKQPQKSTSF